MLTYKRYILSFFLLLNAFVISSSFSEGRDNDNAESNPSSSVAITDTVQALVVYGDHYLFEAVRNLSYERLLLFRDSLLHLESIPFQLVKQVDTYLKVMKLTDEDVYRMIDSLFEMEDIPYPLINNINLYIAKRALDRERILPIPPDTSIYPANIYYHSWNVDTPNPYSEALSAKDSVIMLVLQDSLSFCNYVPPIVGVITSNYGWRTGSMHKGMDIDLEVWDTVRAAFPGMVRLAKRFGNYGRMVVVRHYNGLETTYGHLHRIKVRPGQIVEAGELIGLGGSSGRSSGSHLHFECRFKGVPLNPRHFISFKEQKLMNDTLVLKKTNWGYAAFPSDAKFYIVKNGDNLFDIAKKYGTTTNKLCEINGIKRNAYLWVGQKIRII